MPDPSPSPAATWPVLVLPPELRSIDFISDLHLHAALRRTTLAWQDYLQRTSADGLFILGDLFEAWVGDDLLSLPYESTCAQSLADFARGRPVWIQHGNRDFLLGERFFERTGTFALADPTAVQAWGQTILVSHGDALCLADTEYLSFRAMVRTPEWQRAFLTSPLTERMAIGRQMRQASQMRHDDVLDGTTALQFDVDPGLAQTWLDRGAADTLVHGHTHRPAHHVLATGQRIVLTDWDLDHHDRAGVLRWTAAGFDRLSLAQV